MAAAILTFVRDPERLEQTGPRGSVAEILRLRALWFILPLFSVNYAAAAAIRGLWAGPFMAEVYGASDVLIGRATLAMSVAMVIGSFLVGPATRAAGSVRQAGADGERHGRAGHGRAVAGARCRRHPGHRHAGDDRADGASFTVILAHGRAFLPRILWAGGDLPQHVLDRRGGGAAIRLAPHLSRGQHRGTPPRLTRPCSSFS